MEYNHRILYGDGSNGYLPVGESTTVFSCKLANHHKGMCGYCICSECYHKRDKKKTADEKSPMEKHHNTCCHKDGDLKPMMGLWWCDPHKIGKKLWHDRINGCFKCGKMFVFVKTNSFIPKLPKDFKFPKVQDFEEEVRKDYERNDGWRKKCRELYLKEARKKLDY